MKFAGVSTRATGSGSPPPDRKDCYCGGVECHSGSFDFPWRNQDTSRSRITSSVLRRGCYTNRAPLFHFFHGILGVNDFRDLKTSRSKIRLLAGEARGRGAGDGNKGASSDWSSWEEIASRLVIITPLTRLPLPPIALPIIFVIELLAARDEIAPSFYSLVVLFLSHATHLVRPPTSLASSLSSTRFPFPSPPAPPDFRVRGEYHRGEILVDCPFTPGAAVFSCTLGYLEGAPSGSVKSHAR